RHVGTGLGFPTANLRVDGARCLPAAGIYAGRARANGSAYPAAISVGFRPTYGDGPLTIEAHLLDFSGDLYGTDVRLEFTRRLRGGARRVVAVGGDGTLNEVVNGFFDEGGQPLGSGVSLGLIPSGTGGDFRRAAGIPAGAAEAARALAGGATRRIDAGVIEYGG